MALVEKMRSGEAMMIHVTLPEGATARDLALVLEQSGLGPADKFLVLLRDGAFAQSLGVWLRLFVGGAQQRSRDAEQIAVQTVPDFDQVVAKRVVRDDFLGLGNPVPGAGGFLQCRIDGDRIAQFFLRRVFFLHEFRVEHAGHFVLAESGLAPFFRVTVSSEEVARGKPAPDVYLEAASRLEVQPARCSAVALPM